MGDNQTPYLHLNFGSDAERNQNWSKLDARVLQIARGIFANIPAGGDLAGYYPDPTLAPAISARLPPTATVPAQAGYVLTVATTGQFVWAATAANLWSDNGSFYVPAKGDHYPVHMGSLALAHATAPTIEFDRDPGYAANGDTVALLANVRQSGVLGRINLSATEAHSASAQGTEWNLSCLANGQAAGLPDVRLIVSGMNGGGIWMPAIAGCAIGWSVSMTRHLPAEMLDVNGALVLKAATNASPVDGTFHYTGTTFQGRVGGAWVDIPGAGGGTNYWTKSGSVLCSQDPLDATNYNVQVTGQALYFGTATTAAMTSTFLVKSGSTFNLHSDSFVFSTRFNDPSTVDHNVNALKIYDDGGVSVMARSLDPTWYYNESLSVAGGIYLSAPAVLAQEGTIQYASGHFQGYNGTAWVNLDDAGGGGGPPTGAAGGDLAGSSYPNPVVAPGVITRAKTASDLWLPPVPTGADVGKLLTVTAGPALAWQVAALGGSNGSLGSQAIYTTNTTLTTANHDSLINCNAASVQLTLPAFSTALAGQVFRITRVDAQAANQATIMPAGADTIDGVNAFITIAPNESISLIACGTVANGRNWVRVADPTWKTIQAGNVLTPVDGNKVLVSQATGNAMQWGARTVKARLGAGLVGDASSSAYLSLNSAAPFTAGTDNTGEPSWLLRLQGTSDRFDVLRAPATSGTTPAFTSLLAVDGTGLVTIPGPTASGAGVDQAQLLLGTRTIKSRVMAIPSADSNYLSINRRFDGSAWNQDDATKPSWMLNLDAGGDLASIQRQAAGGGNTVPLKVDGTGLVTIPGPTAAGTDLSSIKIGTRTQKGRFFALPASDNCGFTRNLYYDGSAWQRDDTAQPAWMMQFPGDQCLIQRIPAAGGTPVTLLALDNGANLTTIGNAFIGSTVSANGVYFRGQTAAGSLTAPTAIAQFTTIARLSASGCYAANSYADQATILFYSTENWSSTNRGTGCRIDQTQTGTSVAGNHYALFSEGNLTITGATGQKASGTTWANPSDIRLKRDIADYGTGLEAITKLRPVSFKYNGKGGTTDNDALCWGLIADEVAPVMPEMVGTTKAKLDPADTEETDILSLDTSNVALALINAVKELASRVAALEAHA